MIQHILNDVVQVVRDLIKTAEPEQILAGRKLFRPFMKYQHAWISHFYPGDTIDHESNPWCYLQKYVMPLIKMHASSYHVNGIEYLGLDQSHQPDFNSFQQLFISKSNGFSIQAVDTEIAPYEYFSLIREKRFPCIMKMRTLDELFCANEPDFWHEAIGHIAPLCFKEVQDFYLKIADYMLSAKSTALFHQHLAVAWTLMEYGFIKEHGQYKMFGAALVGSHLAHMRHIKDMIKIESAARQTIIDSGFFEEDSPLARDNNGYLRFFCFDHLDVDILFDH